MVRLQTKVTVLVSHGRVGKQCHNSFTLEWNKLVEAWQMVGTTVTIGEEVTDQPRGTENESFLWGFPRA